MVTITTADTAAFTFSVVYSGSTGSITPPDLSDAVVKFMIKKSASDLDSKAVFLQELDHPTSNILYYEIPHETTASLTKGVYKGALKIFYDSGSQITVWSDDVTVSKGVFNE